MSSLLRCKRRGESDRVQVHLHFLFHYITGVFSRFQMSVPFFPFIAWQKTSLGFCITKKLESFEHLTTTSVLNVVLHLLILGRHWNEFLSWIFHGQGFFLISKIPCLLSFELATRLEILYIANALMTMRINFLVLFGSEFGEQVPGNSR